MLPEHFIIKILKNLCIQLLHVKVNLRALILYLSKGKRSEKFFCFLRNEKTIKKISWIIFEYSKKKKWKFYDELFFWLSCERSEIMRFEENFNCFYFDSFIAVIFIIVISCFSHIPMLRFLSLLFKKKI